MVLRQNTRCELKIRIEKKMNLLVLRKANFLTQNFPEVKF
jgi:hypothetical protein